MNWQQRMADALEYIEINLDRDMSTEKIAERANCSPFHFMRMFEVITGMGPAEYVRRRRLSCAAIDLASGDERVIDIALRYRYDSPDAFSRAFKREFGVLPTEARQPGTRLHSYPPLSFSIALIGDKAMEYRIEKGPAYKMTGITAAINNSEGKNFVLVPKFWEDAMRDGRFEALCKKSMETGSKLGVAGVCRDFDMATGDFLYSIAIEKPADRSGLPEGCEDFEVPASTWAKFTSRGPMHPNFQTMIKRIFSEWFPASGKEHEGSAEIEYYPPLPDANAEDYWCEYWVPIK